MNKEYAYAMNQGTLVATPPHLPPVPPLSDRTYLDALNHGKTEHPTAGATMGMDNGGTDGNFVTGHSMTTEEEQLQIAIRLSMEINQPPPPPPLDTNANYGTIAVSEGGSDNKGTGGLGRR